MHTQRHDVQSGNASIQTKAHSDILVFNTSWNKAADYQFSHSPSEITYADGSKLEVWPRISIKQFKQHPDSKYPHQQGYHTVSRSSDWIYEIRKEKSVMGVRTDEYFATYDATPKEEKIEFGRAYKLDAPEAEYETRVIALEIDVPRKPMTISLRIPTMIIESQSVESISFELKYTDKWEVLKLAP